MKVRTREVKFFIWPLKILGFFFKENLDDFNNMWNGSQGASKNTKSQSDKKENFNAIIKESKKPDVVDNSSFISKIFSWFK